ncbi:hypothetical protein BGX34_008365 [Mortierella sp. NVP85]|nr:hypothetical protein BGX34_008365 [Mortierella sp. NVP85]
MATDLPELRQHIAQYLDFATLKAFSLVPQECSASPEKYAHWLETIRKNAISFRHIIYFGDRDPIAPEIYDIMLDRCHGLVSISLFAEPDGQLTAPPIIGAIRRHDGGGGPPSNLGWMPKFARTPWRAYTSHKKKGSDRGDFVNHPGNSSTTSIATSLRLKYLKMPYAFYQGFMEDILSRLAAHSLDDLRVSARYSLRLSPIIQDALWRLTSLWLQEVESGQEKSLLVILEAIHLHQLRRVTLYQVDTESIAKLVEKQHQSLEFMEVQFDEDHSGALADILATCGRLKSLTFSGRHFTDIGALIDPQKPWVCTELEVFSGSLGILFPVEPDDSDQLVSNEIVNVTTSRWIEEQFLYRLGRLTHLRCFVQYEFDIPVRETIYDPVTEEWTEERMMEWSLASGLAHLHGLVNLQTFEVVGEDLPKRIGIPEMVFIKQHWTSLKEMVCDDVGDEDVQEWLATEWPELEAPKS